VYKKLCAKQHLELLNISHTERIMAKTLYQTSKILPKSFWLG